MLDAADRLGEMPTDVLSFREFLEYLRKRGFTHIDGDLITDVLESLKAAPILEGWLPAITHWRPLDGDENSVRLYLESGGFFLTKTVIERRTEVDGAGRGGITDGDGSRR